MSENDHLKNNKKLYDILLIHDIYIIYIMYTLF